MYLYNHFYLKGCSLLNDKLWQKSKINLFSSIKELKVSISFKKYKKNEIISFLFLNLLGFFQKQSKFKLTKVHKISIYENIKIFLFFINFILVYLPVSLMIIQKVNYNIDTNGMGITTWKTQNLFFFTELEKLWELNDNQGNLIKNFNIEVNIKKIFLTFNYQESFFRLLKFPLVNPTYGNIKC